MEVILDGKVRAIDVSECANLAELVAQAELFEAPPGRCVVVGIEIDGESLPPDAMQGLESRRLDDIGRIAIDRRPARAVACSVLQQGARYCGEIVKAIERTVEHLRAGRSQAGNELFADVSDSLTVLIGINASVASVLSEHGDELMALQSDLHPWLEALIQAQSSDDPILIGDLLEFEIAPRIQGFGARMQQLADQEGAGFPSPPSPVAVELSS